MRRWIVRKFGGPEALVLDETAPLPAPGPGEVRVVVRAIGVNFADLIQREGRYPNTPPRPFTPGMESAGLVDAVGPGAPAALLGKAVMGVPIYGGHAEAVCLPASRVMELPAELDFAQGAAFPVAFLTADYALHFLGRARAGERVVVTAAAGGVGTALLQLARLAGLETIAVVGSPAKHALARSLGATHVVGYDELPAAVDAHFREGKIDLVLDSVGGTVFRPLWRRLAVGGRYVLFGFAEALLPKGISLLRAARGLLSMGLYAPYPLVTANRTLAGFNLSVVPAQVTMLRDRAGHLIELARRGEIRPILGEVFPFERLPDAHRYVQSRASTGRVIVKIQMG